MYGKCKGVYDREYHEIVSEFARTVGEADARLLNHELMNGVVRAMAEQSSFKNEVVEV